MAKKRRDLYYQLPKNLDLEELTDEEAGQIWKALNRYDGERVKMPTAAMRLIYKQCVDHIDTENERYDEYCEKRRENIKKRYDKKQESTSVDNCIQVNTHNHNQNHNTESESECKSESQSKSEVSSDDDITADAAVEIVSRRLSDSQKIHEDSEKLSIPEDFVRSELQSLAFKIKNEGLKQNFKTEHDIDKAISWWLIRAKQRFHTNNKNNANDKGHSNFDAIGDETERMWIGMATSGQNQGEVSDTLPF